MKERVDVFVAKVFVDNAVDAHEVLDESVSHWVRRFHLMSAAFPIGHLIGELALPVYAVCTGLVVLVQDREDVVLPVEACQSVIAIL